MSEQDQGASAEPTGLSSTTEPQSSQGLGPSGFDPSRIPHGDYCYSSLSPMDDRGVMKINGLCPYWDRRGHEVAHCHYLNETDGFILWDQVKICEVNHGHD